MLDKNFRVLNFIVILIANEIRQRVFVNYAVIIFFEFLESVC